MTHVDVIKMPDDNCEYRQDSLGAMRGLGSRNEFARQYFCCGDWVPHHKPSDSHDDGAPYYRQILDFFPVIVSSVIRPMLTHSQVIADIIIQVLEIFYNRQHGPAHLQDINPVEHIDDMEYGNSHQYEGTKMVYQAGVLYPAEGLHYKLAEWRLGVLL